MPEYYMDLKLRAYGDRNSVRMFVVNELSKEECGTGKGELATRYTYYVETLKSGSRIYLRRPAYLYNGFDFVVCVENINFNPAGKRKRNYPTHEDILNDLLYKKAENKSKYKKLFQIIKNVYNCEQVPDIEYIIDFENGFSSDLIIKTLKWLFIEQDIRYWNYSGRDMLWNAIINISK